MYTLNGFSNIPRFANNSPGSDSPIGEISPQALTYSREVGQYSLTVHPDVKLFSFLSADDTGLIKVPDAIAAQALEFSQWLYNRTAAGQQSMARDQILRDLLATYGAVANNFDCGQVLSTSDGRYSLPEWLSWKNVAYESGNNFCKVWFSDPSFRNQYDHFQNLPVYPWLPVDAFFNGHDYVVGALASLTLKDGVANIERVKAGKPETVLWGDTFDYVSPLNGLHYPVPFSVLIHGQAGNSIDNIKESIVQDILANTTHTRDEWVAILPDLFKRTEVIVGPFWDEFAMPDSAMRTGIHSPVQLHVRNLAMGIAIAPGYPAYHIEQNLQCTTLYYKSLGAVVIGGIESRDEKFRLTDYFPDYIVVDPNSNDFSRMSRNTTGWIEVLAELLLAAEEMTLNSTVPQGITRTIRNGIIYAVKSYNNVQYLVTAKSVFI